MILTISGKAYSGKDTLADLLTDRLHEAGRIVHRVTFSDLLRNEASYGLAVLKEHLDDRQTAACEIAAVINISLEQAADFCDLLAPDVRANTDLTMAHRTPGTRMALISMGSTWRPAGHWAKRLLLDCLAAEDRGQIPVVVGNRYRDEYDLFAPVATSVRLDITETTQDARALARDGHILAESVRTSTGETALDEADFDIRLDTDDLTPEQIADAVAAAVTLP